VPYLIFNGNLKFLKFAIFIFCGNVFAEVGMSVSKGNGKSTQESRILGILSNVLMGPVSLVAFEGIGDLKINTFKKMENDGLITMADGLVEITDLGRTRYEEIMEEMMEEKFSIHQ
jgi:hypothetical protein